MHRAVAIIVCSLGLITSASGRTIEATFDDDPASVGASNGGSAVENLEDRASALGAGAATITLTGTATRSSISEGRYGRAADFPGGAGGVEASPWYPEPSRGIHMWLKPRSTANGSIVAHGDRWDVHFVSGAIVVTAESSGGTRQTLSSGATWPGDGLWHHVSVLKVEGSSSQFTIAIDFGSPQTVEFDFVPKSVSAPLRFAVGYDGLLDEILTLARVTPTASDLVDRDPGYCPAGTQCVEDVITTTPTGFPHAVPVRFKAMVNPSVCTAMSPCPLLFAVSPGGFCADDYDSAYELSELAASGFVVVTVDLYCEVGDRTSEYPTETSQLVAVKNHIFGSGDALLDLVDGTDYMAVGCSHGAETVQAWSLLASDYPRRTFVRSSGGSGMCALAAGIICEQPSAYYANRFGLTDYETAAMQDLYSRTDLVHKVTKSIVASREIARSWGVNTSGPICSADGSFACAEEGLWGMTYGSKRFRTRWQQLENQSSPTGYFVEDSSKDCNHCSDPGTPAWDCGVCLLKHGRGGMAAHCPECLSYSSSTTDSGDEAEACPIDASWFEDPLSWGSDDPPSEEEDPETGEAPGPGPSGSGRGGGGGCTAASPAATGWWLLCVLVLLGRTRRDR